jgi:hypothetical protein
VYCLPRYSTSPRVILIGGNFANLFRPVRLQYSGFGKKRRNKYHAVSTSAKYPLATYFAIPPTNPYLNYHRPCAQADISFDEKGRRRCLYRRYQTPLETLLALPNPAQYLRPGLTPAVLQRIAATRSDTEAAERMQQAKRRLFAPLRPPAGGPWK